MGRGAKEEPAAHLERELDVLGLWDLVFRDKPANGRHGVHAFTQPPRQTCGDRLVEHALDCAVEREGWRERSRGGSTA